VTFGKTATASYGCISPGRRTVIDSFLEETLTTSTVGAGGVPGAAVPELEFEPHDAQSPIAALRTAIHGNWFRIMPSFLSQTRSPGHQDRSTLTALRPGLE
jgi:hypothetical protein